MENNNAALEEKKYFFIQKQREPLTVFKWPHGWVTQVYIQKKLPRIKYLDKNGGKENHFIDRHLIFNFSRNFFFCPN